jgi:hypothetical protein
MRVNDGIRPLNYGIRVAIVKHDDFVGKSMMMIGDESCGDGDELEELSFALG